MPSLSLVIPMYNEQENVMPLLERVHEASCTRSSRGMTFSCSLYMGMTSDRLGMDSCMRDIDELCYRKNSTS